MQDMHKLLMMMVKVTIKLRCSMLQWIMLIIVKSLNIC